MRAAIHLHSPNESSIRFVHDDVLWPHLFKDVFVGIAIVGVDHDDIAHLVQFEMIFTGV